MEHTERQFLQGSVVRLGEYEIDEGNFKAQKTDKDNQVLPGNCVQGDGVDESREESSTLAEELEPRNTLGTHVVREELNEIGVGKSIVSEGVSELVQKD